MKTMYHPDLPAIQEVPDEDVEAWAEQGWLKNKPASQKAAENKKGATS